MWGGVWVRDREGGEGRGERGGGNVCGVGEGKGGGWGRGVWG